jgi:hypothetical protein
MDSLLGNARELENLVVVGQAQLEPRRAQSQPEQKRVVYWRTATYTDRAFGPSNSQRKIA